MTGSVRFHWSFTPELGQYAFTGRSSHQNWVSRYAFTGRLHQNWVSKLCLWAFAAKLGQAASPIDRLRQNWVCSRIGSVVCTRRVRVRQNWVSTVLSAALAWHEYFRPWLLTVVANSFKRQWTKASYAPRVVCIRYATGYQIVVVGRFDPAAVRRYRLVSMQKRPRCAIPLRLSLLFEKVVVC